jgi:hypothetical protein
MLLMNCLKLITVLYIITPIFIEHIERMTEIENHPKMYSLSLSFIKFMLSKELYPSIITHVSLNNSI